MGDRSFGEMHSSYKANGFACWQFLRGTGGQGEGHVYGETLQGDLLQGVQQATSYSKATPEETFTPQLDSMNLTALPGCFGHSFPCLKHWPQ